MSAGAIILIVFSLIIVVGLVILLVMIKKSDTDRIPANAECGRASDCLNGQYCDSTDGKCKQIINCTANTDCPDTHECVYIISGIDSTTGCPTFDQQKVCMPKTTECRYGKADETCCEFGKNKNNECCVTPKFYNAPPPPTKLVNFNI